MRQRFIGIPPGRVIKKSADGSLLKRTSIILVITNNKASITILEGPVTKGLLDQGVVQVVKRALYIFNGRNKGRSRSSLPC